VVSSQGNINPCKESITLEVYNTDMN